MYKLLIFFSLFLVPIQSISLHQIYLPQEISIELGTKIIKISEADRKEILEKSEKADINYTTVGMQFETTHSIAKILVPQTYDTTALIEQCLIYYSFLGSEEKMQKETLLVYPFFAAIEKQAAVAVSYSGRGLFKIKIREWETVSMPPSPSVIEAEIFNMVLDQSFSGSQNFETIPDEVFEYVARKNDIDRSIVEEIYRKVLLWQKSQ